MVALRKRFHCQSANISRRAMAPVSHDYRCMVNGQPSDVFIGRYLPQATETEKDDARQALQTFIAVLRLIDARMDRERSIREIHGGEIESA